MPSLNELLHQGLAVAVVSAAATSASPAISMNAVQIAQQSAGSQQSKGALKAAPRPSSKSTTTPSKKELNSNKKPQSGGYTVYDGGCGPAQ